MSSSKLHLPPPPFSINILSAKFPDEVTRHILSFHRSMDVKSARPQKDQWTVLACYFSFEPTECKSGEEGEGSINILTLATGVKCLGGNVRDRDHVLVDMHAEILARRELESYMMEEMSLLESDTESLDDVKTNRPTLLERLPPEHEAHTTRFRKRPNVKLFLYTSHAPCGPASSSAHLSRLQKEDEFILNCLSHLPNHASSTQLSTYRLSKLDPYPAPSKKPSRGDAFPTTAYTCSDKLSRCQVLGFQGGRLSTVLSETEGEDAIRLDGIIVGEDYDEKGLRMSFGGYGQNHPGKSRLIEGLSEITKDRTEERGMSFLRTLSKRPFQIWHTSLLFPHSRASSLSNFPDPLSTPPTTLPAHIDVNLPLPLLREALIVPSPTTPFSVASSWHAGSTVQIISPTGLLAGISKKKVEVEGERAKWSRICRGRMWEESEKLQQAVGIVMDAEGKERRKGSEAWKVVSGWMEEKGPFAGWHGARGEEV